MSRSGRRYEPALGRVLALAERVRAAESAAGEAALREAAEDRAAELAMELAWNKLLDELQAVARYLRETGRLD